MKLEETNRSLDEQLQSAMDDVGEKTTELETVSIESVYNITRVSCRENPTWPELVRIKSVGSVKVSCHWKTTELEMVSMSLCIKLWELSFVLH